MTIKIGINGFGRIAGGVIRASLNMPEIEIAGINVRNADLEYMAYQLKYDSVLGRFPGELATYEEGFVINGKKVPVYSFEDASQIPWGECGAEYIVEGTGAYLTTEKAMAHINAGAKKVIMTAPAKDDTPMFVYGVNNEKFTKDMLIVSNASCTTNCTAPVVKVLNDNFGVEMGLMSTIHAATAKQKPVDSRSMKDWRTGRSVFGNIIPTTTGAAKAVGKVIPEVAGKMTGSSYRVPTSDVSLIDLNVVLKKDTNLDEIKAAIKKAAEGELKGVLEYTEDEVVSSDFIGYPVTSIFDANMAVAVGTRFFKVVAFYDNEFGYCNQVLNMIKYMAKVDNE